MFFTAGVCECFPFFHAETSVLDLQFETSISASMANGSLTNNINNSEG
jgi:hypothetical protein